jgi:hypothetical protein
MPFELLTNTPLNIVTVLANQSSQPTIMSISGEGPAAIHALAAQRTGAARVFLQIQDGTSPRGLMNTACHIDTIFGNYNAGNRPYPLAEALYVDETRALMVAITDISGADNEVRIRMECQRLLTRFVDSNLSRARARMEQRQYLSMPYFYTLDAGFLDVPGPAGTEVQGTITIGQDHHFELFQLSAVTTSGLGSVDINLVDQHTGESIIDAPQQTNFPISTALITGNASFPVRLHEPRLFEIHSKIIVTAVNVSGITERLHLTLGGRILADRMWR